MIVEGKVNIYKAAEYYDEDGKVIRKDELIMEVGEGELVGEDAAWFERDC